MPVEIPLFAAAVVAALVQFLMHVGEGIGQRVGELMIEKGVEPSVVKGFKVWDKLINHPKGKTLIEILEKKPHDESRQRVVIEDLTLVLQKDSELLEGLEKILGGESNIQEIIAKNQGKAISARQLIEGQGGTQRVISKDKGVVSNSNQEIRSRTIPNN